MIEVANYKKTQILVHVKENSWVGKVAAYKLRSKSCAIVIGATIHLHHSTKEELIKNTAWLRHEICHIKQWKKHGYMYFLLHYLWLSVLYGYRKNPYEIAARKAESDGEIVDDVYIL